MTCEEFEELRIKYADNPQDMTRGMRASVVRHSRECPDCMPRILARLFEHTNRMSEEELATLAAVVDERMNDVLRRVIEEDHKDPEFMAVAHPEAKHERDHTSPPSRLAGEGAG